MPNLRPPYLLALIVSCAHGAASPPATSTRWAVAIRRRLNPALLLCCALSGRAEAQRPSPFRQVDSALTALTDTSRFAVAVAIAHHGRIVWQAGYGFSDAQRAVRATPNTPFAVGSIAKAVTATALMRLAERGAIDLDRPVGAYLPGEVRVRNGDSTRLTPAALATMTAGIPHLSRHYYAATEGRAHSAEALVRQYGQSVFPPGEAYHYSNMSFGVLERLIEKVTGRRFAEVVESEVFRPLRMENSFFAGPANTRSYAIRLTGAGIPVPDYSFTEPEGGASLVASAHDLARFGSMHAGRPIGSGLLTPQSLDRMHRPPRKEWAYGFGMAATGPELFADGSVLGGAGALKMIPREELAVAIVTNAATSSSVTYGYVDRLVEAALAAEGKTQGQVPFPDFFRTIPFTPTPEQIGRWSGLLHDSAGASPVMLEIAADSIFATVGATQRTVVSRTTFGAGLIVLGLPNRALTMTLLPRKDLLVGYATGPSSSDGLGWPMYLELRKEVPPKTDISIAPPDCSQ